MRTDERFMRHWTRAQPVIAGYVSSMVPDVHEADDLLQETAVVLLRKFGDYDPRRPFVAWALGIAKLEILSARRRHARGFLTYHGDLMDAVAGAYGEMAPELISRAGALRRCLQKIEGRAREMLRLRYEESLKPREIAERLAVAAGNVRARLSRIRSSLASCVARALAAGGRSA